MNEREWCPVAAAARILGDRWTLILLRTLAEGPCRFKHLESTGEGISPAVLSARLRELEAHDMITRTSYNEIPPRVEYSLTRKGRDALPVIEALRAYGQNWLTPDMCCDELESAPSRGRFHAEGRARA
jgi:DNA-binding HxlR family transcriptional regulator